jgi:hypothetical protein
MITFDGGSQNPRVAGRSRDRGVCSNSSLSRAQLHLSCNARGNNSRPLSGATPQLSFKRFNSLVRVRAHGQDAPHRVYLHIAMSLASTIRPVLDWPVVGELFVTIISRLLSPFEKPVGRNPGLCHNRGPCQLE